jgi:O-methyltransferase/methyltransferase family protein
MTGRITLRGLFRVLSRTKNAESWTELYHLLRSHLFAARVAKTGFEGQFPPTLFQMATSYWISQAIYVAAKLGIADLLKSRPLKCNEIAASAGTDVRSLSRLMRTLSSLGIFAQTEDGYFSLLPLGENLRADIPGSLKAIIITLGEIHYQACGALLHAVRTGSPAFDQVFGAGLFEYLDQNTEAADSFNEGMASLAGMLAYAVALAYDLSRVFSIVDVGGGNGRFLETILEIYPEIQGTVFDCSATIERASRTVGRTTRRCSYEAGDFFTFVPRGGDLYFLCGVVHDWDDKRAVAILRNCREAIFASGRLLLLETLVPENNSKHFSKILDLNMLAMSSGRERTRAEFCWLLAAAGFKMSRIITTLAPQSLIEAVPLD